LIEAMLRGVAIIGSRAGAIPEILGEGKYGLLFEPGNLAGLIEAIEQARRERDTMSERAQQAGEYARRTFSVEAMTRQTLEVYQRLR
jgi:glycosyltransferase involved in cell wall biosynthesis